uniref:Uncharacterized protein n=1 Tax=Arion vulgaris TaxID=1028688 RepID=A0A0B7A011_9EUPU
MVMLTDVVARMMPLVIANTTQADNNATVVCPYTITEAGTWEQRLTQDFVLNALATTAPTFAFLIRLKVMVFVTTAQEALLVIPVIHVSVDSSSILFLQMEAIPQTLTHH